MVRGIIVTCGKALVVAEGSLSDEQSIHGGGRLFVAWRASPFSALAETLTHYTSRSESIHDIASPSHNITRTPLFLL